MSETADVILEVEGIQFSSRRDLLRTSSPYFDAMFSGNFKELQENVIVLQDISPGAMKIITNSLTEDSLHIEDEELLPTLQAACMLQFDRIRKYCIETITEILSSEYCLAAYFEAMQLDLKELAQKALCVALFSFTSVIDNKEFKDLTVHQLHHYLSHTALHLPSEIFVFEAALKWWYDYEQAHEHELQDHMNGSACASANDSKCSEILLYVLKCVNFRTIATPDIRLMLTYPGISQHSLVDSVLKCILSIKACEVKSFSEFVSRTSKELVSCEPRSIPKIPCVIGVLQNGDPKNPPKLEPQQAHTSIMYYDEEVENLKDFAPLRHVGNEDGYSLEGFKMQVWKNKILLLGGEYMYGHGCWNQSCWLYDTTKDKWTKLTTLPSVRRHFKSCIAGDELFIIGGTGQYRIVQNNMDAYNIKTDEWVKGIPFPFEIHDVECCEYNEKLFITCCGKKKFETLLYNPVDRQWTHLDIQYPNLLLYDKLEISDNEFRSYRRNYIPFVHNGNLFMSGDYLLGIRIKHSKLEVVYFGPGVNEFDSTLLPVGICVVENNLYVFRSQDYANIDHFKRQTSVQCFNMINKTSTYHEVEKSNVMVKLDAGCFALFHHSLL